MPLQWSQHLNKAGLQQRPVTGGRKRNASNRNQVGREISPWNSGVHENGLLERAIVLHPHPPRFARSPLPVPDDATGGEALGPTSSIA